MLQPLQFPDITDAKLLAEIEERGDIMQVEAGSTIMEPGSTIRMMPLVNKGLVKVSREDDTGNELFLYFLNPGQTCAMSLYCCMANRKSEIRATAEEDTELLTIPIEAMDEWMGRYPNWREFVMRAYTDRFQELLNTIDSIAFTQLDDRLLDYLQQKAAGNNGTVNTTHQKIADDLNSSRVVISRLLKQLEKRGMVELSKNKIRFV